MPYPVFNCLKILLEGNEETSSSSTSLGQATGSELDCEEHEETSEEGFQIAAVVWEGKRCKVNQW